MIDRDFLDNFDAARYQFILFFFQKLSEARLQRLRVEIIQRPQEANPAPVPPPDWAAEFLVARDSVARREDSVGSKAFGRGVAGLPVGG